MPMGKTAAAQLNPKNVVPGATQRWTDNGMVSSPMSAAASTGNLDPRTQQMLDMGLDPNSQKDRYMFAAQVSPEWNRSHALQSALGGTGGNPRIDLIGLDEMSPEMQSIALHDKANTMWQDATVRSANTSDNRAMFGTGGLGFNDPSIPAHGDQAWYDRAANWYNKEHNRRGTTDPIIGEKQFLLGDLEDPSQLPPDWHDPATVGLSRDWSHGGRWVDPRVTPGTTGSSDSWGPFQSRHPGTNPLRPYNPGDYNQAAHAQSYNQATDTNRYAAQNTQTEQVNMFSSPQSRMPIGRGPVAPRPPGRGINPNPPAPPPPDPTRPPPEDPGTRPPIGDRDPDLYPGKTWEDVVGKYGMGGTFQNPNMLGYLQNLLHAPSQKRFL